MSLQLREKIVDITHRLKAALPKMTENAIVADEHSVFPGENINILRELNLMGANIPATYGGLGLDIKAISEFSQLVSSACLSTGIIWAMHCQQVQVLVTCDNENLKQSVLKDIAVNGSYICSVTTEEKKGGELLKSNSPLAYIGKDILLKRNAPIVTGGNHGDYYLVTMNDQSESRAKLILAYRNQLNIKELGKLNTMGMRGVENVHIDLEGIIPIDQLINSTKGLDFLFNNIMIPYGHIGWLSCWLGSVKYSFEKMVNIIRNRGSNKSIDLNSDLLLTRIAQLRFEIDLAAVYLDSTIENFLKDDIDTSTLRIKINNLKLLSQNMYKIINDIIEIVGISEGYIKGNSEFQLERIARDLRAASLMFHNDRILKINGKLSLVNYKLL